MGRVGGDRGCCVPVGGVDEVIRVDLEKHPSMTERLIQQAVAQYVQWWRVTCVPNLCRWHEMDMAVLTRAGYLWEFEIKISQQDWNRDNHKDHAKGPAFWQRPTRDFSGVKRFYYVYKQGLICPEWVPDWVGLIEARYETIGGECYLTLHEQREAKDRKVEKVKPEDREAMLLSIYHRYWKVKAGALT